MNVRHSVKLICVSSAILCLLLLDPSQSAHAQQRASTGAEDLADRISIIQGEKESKWLILPYRPSYILPVTYFDDPNDQVLIDSVGEGQLPTEEFDDVEVKFQISFMLPLWREIADSNVGFYFAYTQVSFWQMYNSDLSEPFRDTNYEPEGVFLWDTEFDVLGFRNEAILFGFNHQSNGRGNEVLTRAWNRIFVNFLLERDDLVLGIKPWVRVGDDDENPNIDKFLGYGEVRAIYPYGENVFSGMFRNNFRVDGNRGAVELAWSRPMNDYIRWYVQYFYGYGENLLDYDYLNHRIGIGIALTDYL